MGSSELSARSRRLLATLVREYIETGEPVASQRARARERAWRVVGDGPQRAGTARRGGLRAPAAHLSRTRPDRSRLSRLRRSAARRPQAGASATDVEHQLRQQAERSPLIDDLLASVTHLVSRAARHVGFALAGSPRRRAAADRVRPARRIRAFWSSWFRAATR